MRVRVTAGAVLVALVALAGSMAPSAFAESSASDFGSRLVTLVNQARAQHGLRALTVAGGTSTVATSWTHHRAQDDDQDNHNDDAEADDSRRRPARTEARAAPGRRTPQRAADS